MLSIENLNAGYFGSRVLQGVSLKCGSGITLVIGPNGAGKSTLVKSVTGTLRPVSGGVIFDGKRIEKLRGHQISSMGIATVPERGRVFTEMTVGDNILFGYESSGEEGPNFQGILKEVFSLFPDLEVKRDDRAGTLSGGQQQMLAIARALARRPKFLVMDEPTTGLFPRLVKELIQKIETISKNMPILLTEQNVVNIVPIASKVYLLESGRIVMSGSPSEILESPQVRKSYIGEVSGRGV